MNHKSEATQEKGLMGNGRSTHTLEEAQILLKKPD